jgi:hypothetical protein
MQGTEPPIIKNAGDIVFPDIDYPPPIKVAAMAAMAWLFFGPVLVGLATRRGDVWRAMVTYAAGAFISALFFTSLSGIWGEPITHRIGVWARNIWAPILGLSLAMGLMAAGAGRASRSRWPVRD